MSSFLVGNAINRLALTMSGFSIVLCCAVLVFAQESNTETQESNFEITGRVISKSDQQIEIRQRDGSVVKIEVNQSTDFALRLTNPWFDADGRQVVVDGKLGENGERERIKFPLGEGKLYLLAQFRSKYHRTRILKASPWRITNYLVGRDPVDGNYPEDDDLFLAGELDLENSALIIDEKSNPIVLGYRNATLRNRSFEDIVAGQTEVMVTGTESGETKTATTILFVNR